MFFRIRPPLFRRVFQEGSDVKRSRRGFSSKASPPWNILFFGSDDVSVATLKLLRKNQVDPAATGLPPVVSNVEVFLRDSAHGAVRSFATAEKLVQHEAPRLKDWQVPLGANGEPFDLAVVVSFGQLVPARVIDAFPLGGINMHPSLVPKYRGAAPIHHALLNGEPETGVSVIELSKHRFDVGRVLLQRKIAVEPTTTFTSLSRRLADIGARSVLTVLDQLRRYQSEAVPQGEEGASMAPKVHREMGFVDWHKLTAQEVYNAWRAFGENIGINTRLVASGETVQLGKLSPPGTAMSYRSTDGDWLPGMLRFDKKQNLVFVKCADDWIGVGQLRPSNRGRLMSATDFSNGYKFRDVRVPSEQHRFVTLVEEETAPAS